MGYFADYMDVPDDAYPQVPDHIDIFTGNFKLGTRKCSKCKTYKTRQDFNGEEEKKSAARRICSGCGPPMPSDLSAFTIPQIKDELRKRGVGHDAVKGLKKAELVVRLQAVLDQEAGETGGANAKPVATSTGGTESTAAAAATPLTRERILALKVVDLRRELKARGKPVSGLKAVLQDRLLAEISPNDDDNSSSEKDKATVKAEAKTLSADTPSFIPSGIGAGPGVGVQKVAAETYAASQKTVAINNSSVDKENSPQASAAMANCPDATSSGNNTGQATTTTTTKKKKAKFYAVAAGRKPGIYTTWEECEPQVKGFSGAKVKSFKTKDEAVAFIKGGFRNKEKKKKQNKKNKSKAGKGPLAPLQPGMPRPFAKCTNTPYTMYASFH